MRNVQFSVIHVDAIQDNMGETVDVIVIGE